MGKITCAAPTRDSRCIRVLCDRCYTRRHGHTRRRRWLFLFRPTASGLHAELHDRAGRYRVSQFIQLFNLR